MNSYQGFCEVIQPDMLHLQKSSEKKNNLNARWQCLKNIMITLKLYLSISRFSENSNTLKDLIICNYNSQHDQSVYSTRVELNCTFLPSYKK